FLLRCVSTVVGAFMPAFYTFKTLAKPNQRAQVYWLKYWAVFGAAMAVECALDFCLISYIIPGYEVARLLFLLYAVNPVTNGAQSLYDNLLKPVFVKHEKRIDAARKEVTASITDRASGMISSAGQILFSATVNRFAAVAAGPAMPQMVNAYNLRQAAPDSHPIIYEIKDEPLDWDEYEDDVEITKVVEPKKRNGRSAQKASVVEFEEQEEEEVEMVDSDESSGDVEFVPAPARGKSSGRGRGRGRGKGKKN
ncbi:hypothetical protein PFISCL1PPCAC_1301, partial [Pristionchus fissidentatus]